MRMKTIFRIRKKVILRKIWKTRKNLSLNLRKKDGKCEKVKKRALV